MVPQGVKQMVSNGHEVLVEKGAGVGNGFADYIESLLARV